VKIPRPALQWVAAGYLAACCAASAQPEEISLSRWLPTRIRQLEDERALLLENIARLPQHDPKPLTDRLGYHALPQEAGAQPQDGSQYIDVQFEYDPQLGAIALVPAFPAGEAGQYAFPKRFKIEIIDRGAAWVGDEQGQWVVPPPPYEWIEVVSWMDEDFPDPGLYPVFFPVGEVRVHQLRMTVPRMMTESNAAYHALGELYLFRQQENGQLGDNMMVWGDTVSINASDSFSKAPIWDDSYLYDGVTGLGLPLSEDLGGAEDFTVLWDGQRPTDEPVQIILDLGRLQPIGRVQLWPAEAPHAMAIPHYGFPGRVSVETSELPGFEESNLFVAQNVRRRLHRDNLLNVITGGKEARYIRITLDDLGQYKGNTMLGLGEIRVSEFDEVWSLNCAVKAAGLPPAGLDQLPRLVDGFSRQRRILREVEWIMGLAQRRPLDRRLAVVEQELALARADWGGFKLRAGIWGGGLLCAALLGALALQRLQRRQVLKKVKHRITRDLHDEVGSSLGGITLAARRMEGSGASRTDLSELSLMAREASASLRDVVWLTDQGAIRLPDLLKKMAERAERILLEVELTIDMPDHCPDREVPLTFKRHLLMFFKEAVHNCARHSGATAVRVSMSVNQEDLELCLGKRAREMGGEMKLETRPGAGTAITLTVPLSVLLKKTVHSYKTSN
jgi:hypothetical protein